MATSGIISSFCVLHRAVGVGGAGLECPPPFQDFSRSVNPISTKGADYAHHITTWPPHEFSDLPTALLQTTHKGGSDVNIKY